MAELEINNNHSLTTMRKIYVCMNVMGDNSLWFF